MFFGSIVRLYKFFPPINLFHLWGKKKHVTANKKSNYGCMCHTSQFENWKVRNWRKTKQPKKKAIRIGLKNPDKKNKKKKTTWNKIPPQTTPRKLSNNFCPLLDNICPFSLSRRVSLGKIKTKFWQDHLTDNNGLEKEKESK